MNKLALLFFVLVLFVSTAYAQTNTTVQSGNALRTDSFEFTWDGDGTDYVPKTFTHTICQSGSCATTSGTYNILDYNSYNVTCDQAAAASLNFKRHVHLFTKQCRI